MTKLLSTLFFVVSCLYCSAQHLPGLANGNYAGTHALYHNPAFVSDSRYAAYLNLAGTQFYVANNHVRYDAPFSFLRFITNTVPNEYRNERGAVNFPRTYLLEKLNNKKKYLNLGGDVRPPGLMLSLFRGKAGIAATTRMRYELNSSDVTEGLARLVSKTQKDSSLLNQTFTGQSGKLNMTGLAEIALTLGGVVLDNDTDFFKIGITAKRLIGLYHVNMQLNNADFTVRSDPAYPGRRNRIIFRNIDAAYGYTSESAFQNFQFTPQWIFGNQAAGNGWGFDLGMVYEYRPDAHRDTYTLKGREYKNPETNKYLYRISASVTDIGSVNFKNPVHLHSMRGTSMRGDVNFDTFQELKGTDGFFNSLRSDLGLPGEGFETARILLPLTVQVSVDYHVQKKWYVNAMWVQNLRPKGVFGMKGESVFAVTPRYETRWIDFSAPVSLLNDYRSLGIGLAGRAGPLWFGTDHITGLLNIGNPKAMNLYFGISAGILRKKPDLSIPCWPARRSWIRRIFSSK